MFSSGLARIKNHRRCSSKWKERYQLFISIAILHIRGLLINIVETNTQDKFCWSIVLTFEIVDLIWHQTYQIKLLDLEVLLRNEINNYHFSRTHGVSHEWPLFLLAWSWQHYARVFPTMSMVPLKRRQHDVIKCQLFWNREWMEEKRCTHFKS